MSRFSEEYELKEELGRYSIVIVATGDLDELYIY